MKDKTRIFASLLIAAGLIGGIYMYRQGTVTPAPGPAPAATSTSVSADEQAVRDLVARFGDKLKMVSLAAPEDQLAASIREHYGPFVSEDLLAAWEAGPSLAPGRFTSSPWPKEIKVLLVEHPDDSYEVQGFVIEVTSVEEENGGIANQYPVALKVRERDGRWVITGFSKALPE